MHGCSRIRRSARLALLLLALAAPAGAVPDLASRRVVAGVTVFADDQRADLFHYAPAEMRLVRAEDGRPDLSFVDMRYTGNALARDRGLTLHKSLLTIRVELPAHPAEVLASCARQLGPAGRAAELRPLPIRRLSAALLFISIGASADTVRHGVPGGRLLASREHEGPVGEGYWRERVFSVGLDSLTAQALRATFEQGLLSMSLAYAVVADGRVAREPWGLVDAPPMLAEALGRELAAEAAAGAAGADSMLRRVVASGVIPIHVDARRFPDLMRRVDLDAGTRTGYAAMDVYCYDFRDNRRPDLYEKQVEVEAESVAGRPVRLQAVFARAHPDVYQTSLRFPVAVRLDRPYRYRVAEVRPDGSSTQGGWRAGRDWLDVLDLTTPAPAAATGVRPIR